MAIVSANGAATPLSPNYIINGAFDFWQRGTSFTASGYTADRWYSELGAGAGTTSRQAFAPGAAPVQGYEGTYFLRKAVTTGGQFQSIIQRIEDVRTFAGQTVTLSFWAKGTNPAGNYAINLIQNFGSGGSGDVGSTFITPPVLTVTDSWTRYSYTISVPSVAGKTIGANSYLWTTFYQAGVGSSAYTMDIWGVQLEAGGTATPFRRNANSIQGELAACQRYFQRFYSPALRGTVSPSSTTSANRMGMQFPVPLRATPTTPVLSGTINVYDGSTTGSFTSLTTNYSSATTFEADFSLNSTFNGGRPASVFQGGNGYIDVSAEL